MRCGHSTSAFSLAVVIGDPRLTTGRWHEVYEERARAARAAEQKKQAEAEARFLGRSPRY
jgi:hypothetical protein